MKRKYSLKSNKEIASLFKEKVSVGNHFYAIYYRRNKQKKPRIAISVSKKYGNAVVRNYEKRVTRQIVQKYFNLINGMDLLIVIRRDVNTLKFIKKQQHLEYLLKKINKQEKMNDKY